MQDATLLMMLNLIGASCSALLAFSLFQIPYPSSGAERSALRYLRLTVVIWAGSFTAGSLQVLAKQWPELRTASILLANLGYVTSYFFICIALTRRYSNVILRIKSWPYAVLAGFTISAVILLKDDFVLRNQLMPLLHASLLLCAIVIVHRSQRAFHRGDRYLKLCLYLLLANSIITNTALVEVTMPGIATSLRVLLFILLNGIVLMTAIYAMFLNDVIEQTKNDGMIDALSGAFNRRFYNELPHHEPKSFNGCVVMCDIDDFKKINDTYGHHVGDLVIQQFAQLLKTTLRPDDQVIRLGGEEFLLILFDTRIEQAQVITKRICQQVANARMCVDQERLGFTASFGVAAILQSGLANAVQRADLMLYQAKHHGKNQVVAEEHVSEDVIQPLNLTYDS